MKDSSPNLPSVPTIILLIVSLACPPLFVVITDFLFGKFPSLGIQIALQLLYCGMAGFVVWGVVRLERLSLKSIGIRQPGWSTIISATLVILLGLFLQPLIITPLAKAFGSDGVDTGLQQLTSMPTWFRVCLGITGGAIEELFYRGYAVERLATITGNWWLGGTLATIAFALAHIPTWGLGFALSADLLAGIILTLFYLWRRDLIANMLAHSAGLVVGMILIAP